MSDRAGRPHLASDKDYLKQVAGSIAKREATEVIEFACLTDVLKVIGIETDPYKLVSLEQLYPPAMAELIAESFRRLATLEPTPEQRRSLDALWDFLAVENKLKPAELGFVFGGPGMGRVERAIELYQQGAVQRLLFTGGHASYLPAAELTEARQYRDMAVAAGVRVEDILIEEQSINTPQNAKNSVALLHQIGYLPPSVVLFTASFHMRRAYLTFKTVLDWEAELICQPVVPTEFSRADYFRNEQGWGFVFSECIKIYGARLMGHF